MANQNVQQQGDSMTIKCLMITGSNDDPRRRDDWITCEALESDVEYSLGQLSLMAEHEWQALWIYEGPDWEDKTKVLKRHGFGLVEYEKKFYPWDHPEYLTLIREASGLSRDEDEWYEAWNREIAMEEGMLQGVNAYNDWMGY